MNDNLKQHWNKYYLEHKEFQTNVVFIESFLKEYFPKIKEPLIDVGCGNGRALYAIYKNGFQNIYGIDFSQEAIISGKKLFHDTNIRNNLICDNMEHILNHFPNTKFNTLLSVMSLQQGDYSFAKKSLEIWNNILSTNGLVYILTRSDSIFPKDYRKIDSNTIYIPRLNILRTHFNPDSLRNILPENWKILNLEEIFYDGLSNKISALELVAIKSK